jgi:O-antigen/teichoic acid export membrane protein
LNSLLIPQYGALGATVASLITYSYVSILVNFYIIKELKVFGSLILGSLNLYKAASRLLGAIWSLKLNQTSRTAGMVPMLARYSKQ